VAPARAAVLGVGIRAFSDAGVLAGQMNVGVLADVELEESGVRWSADVPTASGTRRGREDRKRPAMNAER
jgi:hypothetical protein